MNQNNLVRRLVLIALFFALGSLFMAPGSIHAQENGDEGIDLDNLKSVDEVDSINTYRFHIALNASGEAFELEELTGLDILNIAIDGEVIKNPLALRMMMSLDQNTELDDIEMIMVDGKTYVNITGEWEETDSPFPDTDEVLNTANQAEIGAIEDLFERVGVETLNGRQTVHYRADKESLAQASIDEPEVQMFLANAEEAQFDIWVDQSENFMVKMQLVVAGKGFNEDMPEAYGRIEIILEFYDFNAPITITAPISPEPEPPISPEPEPQPQPDPQPDSAFEPEALPVAKSIWEKAQE